MTTATMATPAKTKIENVSLRTFLEKNGIGGRLGNGLVMDPTHLNIIPGFNTRTAGLGEAYWELPEVKDHLARLAQQYADSPLEMAPMVVQVRDGQVVIRQGHCRHRAIPLANKIREERGEGPVDKIRVDEFRGSDGKAELFNLKGNDQLPVSIVAQAESLYRLHNDSEEPMSIEELAEARKVSVTHVRKLLKVHTAPEALKGLVVKGVVAYYAALDVMEKYPDNCVAIIQEAFDKFGKATDKTIGQVILAQRTGENGPTGESDGNVTTITTTDAGDASGASGASGGAVDGSAGSVAGAAGGSEEGAESNNTEPTPTPAPKREPKPNIKTQPSVFDVLPKKISKEIVDNSLDVINRIVTEAKEIPFMEDGAEVLAKAQYQLTLSYEEFLLLTAAKDSYDKHLEKIQKKTTEQ
ncbi:MULTISPECIES: hypothetical protein [Enterobacterales]|uniref:ParB/RepB/Spo0J family partition protein n=7 Tax=Enterobacteriaceae TaxID=543 RepID=A0AAW9C194_KLUCR|nr:MULTISPECIES: hypothetical protein [Enterobacterales]EFE7907296.1 hypothetical protein [Escherichia coli]EFM2411553.1 hypothetical protein [Escherichia coli]EJU24075.1 hypothetical protein HMPREF1144_0323 [Klebsiella sp. OBRC7]EKW4787409.1 hypothetical protein [Klebsiella variicola]EKX4099381.1 hypothetical protein [Klebsiella pneumoniae]